MAQASTALTFTFTGVVLVTALMVMALVRHAYLGAEDAPRPQPAVFRAFFSLGIWMALTASLASSGLLAGFDSRPPPMMLLMGVVLVGSVVLVFSPFGTRLVRSVPLAWLIGFQGFRFPLELVMHWAAVEHVMPFQMSYSGRNLDILSGITAIVVGVLLWRGFGTRQTPWLWNVLGTGLLINVLVVAVRSLPTFAHFGPDQVNVWITHAPFVWLPTVLVPFALIGHLLLWRRLLGGTAEAR